MNPVLAKLVEKPEDWEYSNYKDWIGVSSYGLTDYKLRDQYFSSGSEYKLLVEEAIADKLMQKEMAESDLEY
ncbi:MAG: hypothetical protein K9N06_10100 [Candidatus Cloacimonetes bacterium]|nr:hypothetical protein [Candidatus Cloacimonadota bacterium]